MISNIVVGLITGALSSWIVATIFYRKGRRDAIDMQLQGHLSALALAMERFDPNHNSPGRRGDDGLEPTTHMLGCMIRVLDRDGFTKTADALRPISAEMETLVTTFDRFDEAYKARKKEEWQAALVRIRSPKN